MLKLAAKPDLAFSSTRQFRVHVCLIGPIALVGMEGEMFSGYALDLARTASALESIGDFQVKPIVVGYANGCIGYVPTESEFPWGGYEVCNAFRIYGHPTNLQCTAERDILYSTNALLSDAVGEAVAVHKLRGATGKLKADGATRRKGRKKKVRLAFAHDSCFSDAHDTYNSIGTDKDGMFVYFVLSSERINVGARLYRLDSSAAECEAVVEDLGDMQIKKVSEIVTGGW